MSVPTGNTYDKYGSTNPIERRMMSGFFAALDRMVGATAPKRILEVGIGEGIVTARLAERFPDSVIVGLDLPDPELAAQWETLGLDCVFGDATRLPYPDDAFDLVLAVEVFEHFDDSEMSQLDESIPDEFWADDKLQELAETNPDAFLSIDSMV